MSVTYTLALDSLDGAVAGFVWTSLTPPLVGVRFSITRQEWAEMGRPTTLTVEVKA